MDDIKPQGEVFNDQHEMDASNFLESFKNQKEKEPELLRKASLEFGQSTNPEGKEISQLLQALYLREKGIREKDDEKACKYLIKSATTFGRDTRSKKESQRVMLEFYHRKIEFLHKRGKKATEIFQKKANIFKSLGKEKDFHAEMSLYYLFLSTENIKDLNQAITLLESSLKHAQESGKDEIVHKVQVLLHRLKSYASPTLEQAIKEIEQEVKEIEKTSDRYGYESSLGDLSFLKSRMEKEPEKRSALLNEAANYYQMAGLDKKAHQLLGDVLQIKANKSKVQDEDHAELYKKASEEYAKAGNIRMQKWVEGHYEIALAAKRGILIGNTEEFKKHLISANHLYAEAGNFGGVQFTAGVGIFLEAVRADFPQSLELFKSAADCLESVKEISLASFARSEISRLLAYKAENQEERNKFMLEEKNYLERAVIESEKRSSKSNLNFLIDGVTISSDVLTILSKARLHELNGFLEGDRELAKTHFQKAKEQYLSIEGIGAYTNLVLSGIGWTSLFLDDIAEAKKYFEKLEEIDPDNPHVKSGMEALGILIKDKYSTQAESFLIKQRLSTPLIISLTGDVSVTKNGKPHPSEFFNLCLAIVKRSCNQIERYRKNFFNSDEPSLRNEILMLSNSVAQEGLGTNLSGETFTGEGKSDLLAKDPQDDTDYFIGECKIWGSPGEYKSGFQQLVGRYLTGADKAGVLINFIKDGNINEIFEKSIKAIEELDSQATIRRIDDKNFFSSHKDYGIIFHRFVDLIPSKQKV